MAAENPIGKARAPSHAKLLVFFICLISFCALWVAQKETQSYLSQLSQGTDEWVDTMANSLMNSLSAINMSAVDNPPIENPNELQNVRPTAQFQEHQHNETTLDRSSYSPSASNDTHYEEFVKHDGVVIVTKLHGMPHIKLLEQSICLLHFAYNYRLKYDIVVFTTEPLEDSNVTKMRELMGGGVKLTVVQDNRGFQEEVAALSPIRREKFLKRCKVNSSETLDWWSMCPDRLAYNWQAEFRSLHIWRHPALAPYKYMLWMDTDGFPTHVWPRDPVAVFLQRKLYIMFANFPQGRARHGDANRRIFDGTGKQLCKLTRGDDGVFRSELSSTRGSCKHFMLPMIHGFFHITDLDFYRSEKVHKVLETWIGDCFCCRYFDVSVLQSHHSDQFKKYASLILLLFSFFVSKDQAAVTIPPAVFGPERMMLMRDAGVYLDVFHNGEIYGEKNVRHGGYLRWWRRFGAKNFSEAHEGKCPITAGA